METGRLTRSVSSQGSSSQSTTPFPSMSDDPDKTPGKAQRSLSDSHSIPQLSPSPSFKESSQRLANDQTLMATPTRPTSRRTNFSALGFSLQMPPRDPSFTFASHSRSNSMSQQTDNSDNYPSPSSVLPRHSRGLEFARAATNLHHSTLADHPSPESSPTITHRSISRRPSTASFMMIDTPNLGPGGWRGDKALLSRSYGSATALTSDNSSSDSDDDDAMSRMDDADDPMLLTPQLRKVDNPSAVTPFDIPRSSCKVSKRSSPITFGPNTRRRATLSRYRGANRSAATPGLESALSNDDLMGMDEGYFGMEQFSRSPASRRESLSLGTRLHISSNHDTSDDSPTLPTPSTPGVVRRPVVRRSNLLPKSRNFSRVKAQLLEEGAPVDSEVKREAEVIRQVMVNDVGTNDRSTVSPNLEPRRPELQNESSTMSDVDSLVLSINTQQVDTTIEERRRSHSKEFWPNLYNRNQTPPPGANGFRRPRSSSGFSSDMGIDSPHNPTPPSDMLSRASTAISDTKPDTQHSTDPSNDSGFQTPSLPTAAEVSRKINAKRRRDDDFDPSSIKRRAVSPGMSVASSPTMGQSPVSSNGAWWGQQSSRPNNNTEERAQSASSTGHATPVLGPKRVGMQGMLDTNEGITKMSLE